MIINGDPKGKNILYCNGKTVVIRDIEVRKPSGPVLKGIISCWLSRYTKSEEDLDVERDLETGHTNYSHNCLTLTP